MKEQIKKFITKNFPSFKEEVVAGVYGRYRFAIVDATSGEMIERSDWIDNKVVKNNNNGVNNVASHLAGVTTSPLEIATAGIGTGTTAPADGDTALESGVLTGITLGGKILTGNTVDISIFITDAELANGTYTELALYYGNGDLFARSLIVPAIVKGTNQNISIDYQVKVNN